METFTKIFGVLFFLLPTLGILSIVVSLVIEKDHIKKSFIHNKTTTHISTTITTPSSFDEVIVIFPEEDSDFEPI